MQELSCGNTSRNDSFTNIQVCSWDTDGSHVVVTKEPRICLHPLVIYSFLVTPVMRKTLI